MWAIYLPLVVPLCAAAGARTIASRLPPQVATWLLTGAAVALAALSTAVLGLLACTAILRIPLVATLGHMSVQVFRRYDPASLSAAVGAAALLALAVAAAGRATWRRVRALVSAARHARCLPGSSQVVVVPDGSRDHTPSPAGPAGSSSPPACWTLSIRTSAACCSRTSARTPRATTTCSRR